MDYRTKSSCSIRVVLLDYRTAKSKAIQFIVNKHCLIISNNGTYLKKKICNKKLPTKVQVSEKISQIDKCAIKLCYFWEELLLKTKNFQMTSWKRIELFTNFC